MVMKLGYQPDLAETLPVLIEFANLHYFGRLESCRPSQAGSLTSKKNMNPKENRTVGRCS